MTEYLARGPFCFGLGSTIETAIKNMKRNWPSKTYFKKRFSKKLVKEDPGVVDIFSSEEGKLAILDMFGTVKGPNDLKKLEVSEWIDLVFKKRKKSK